jgi:hypothetical protein
MFSQTGAVVNIQAEQVKLTEQATRIKYETLRQQQRRHTHLAPCRRISHCAVDEDALPRKSFREFRFTGLFDRIQEHEGEWFSSY